MDFNVLNNSIFNIPNSKYNSNPNNSNQYNSNQYSSNQNPNNLKDRPKLVEPGVKYFFKNVLKSCNNFKQNNYNIYYNISLTIIFFLVLGTFLYSRYKGNLTKEEIYQKNLKDKQYIMSKLVYYNKHSLENQQRISNNMITNLPDYGNHPEASLLHRKIYF